MIDGSPKIKCSSCGKTYTWKPAYAGRMLKCTCGAMIKAPATAPAPMPAPAPVPDDDAPPPPDISSADEFEKAFSGGYDTQESAATSTATSKSGGFKAAVASSGAPKERHYQMDYGDDIGAKVLKLRIAMAVLALLLLVGGAVTWRAIARVTKDATPPMRIVTFENGNKVVIEANSDPSADAANSDDGDASPSATTKPTTAPAPKEETPEEKALRLAHERAAKEDEKIAAIIKDEKLTEAREWLKDDNGTHAGHRLQLPMIMGWADQFYAAGAKTVWMRAEKDGRYEIADEWIIEMPEDPAARKEVLKKRSQLHHEISITDLGNKYLLFPVDAYPG